MVKSRQKTELPVIKFDNVTYTISNKTILESISFEVNFGEVTGILGSNGAGKTSILSLINGLHTKTSGEISVFGQSLPAKDKSWYKNIGVVFQETALYEELTVFENLYFTASLYNIKNIKKRIEEVLLILKLSDRTNHTVNTLSGGLKRRVAIARSLLHSPKLLIIDEPTLGVDAEARHAIWSHLRYLKSTGTTIVVATNHLDEVQALCDKAIVLRNGKMLVMEKPEKLISRSGSCIDIECDLDSIENLSKDFDALSDVIRIDKTESGISLFLKTNAMNDQKIRSLIAQYNCIRSFRLRSPDLSEVFKSFDKE
jgi:ABC-2 type transport system ATP-binding protein